MKYGYIQYGNMSKELYKLSPEQRNKKMEEYKATAEKEGWKMLMWGHPFGVSEDIVVVYETPKPLGAMFEDSLPSVMTAGRTHIVAIPEKKEGVAAQP
jgi:hypothetical protein